MTTNVSVIIPCDLWRAEDGKIYAFSLHIMPDVYGVGATEDDARENFQALAMARFETLRETPDFLLSAVEARELEYMRGLGL